MTTVYPETRDGPIVVMVETNKPDVQDQDEADARRVLLAHRVGRGGMCAGCLEFAANYSPFPCTQARWALKVTAALAGGEQS